MNHKKMSKITFLAACVLLINICAVSSTQQADKTDWETVFLSLPETSYAYEHLAYYTSLPHIAGSPEDYETAMYTAEKLKSYGLNNTHIVPTNVLLSYPKKRVVEMIHPTIFRAALTEDVIPTDPTTSDPRIVDTFNGYSPSGNVTGELVYVNYASMDDFATLASLGVNVSGKIGIARYGELFRGTKAMIAQNYGMIGLLIYSDPADDGYVQGPVFPEGPWRPATGVQRGSVQFLSICPGDPTRSVCSNNINYNYTMGIPSIPVQPLSWQDAYPLLANLGHTQAPSNFQGGLNFTYHVGPGPTQVHIYLEMNFLENHPIWNVITTIEGVDNQKTVMLGNHRDAWVFGSTDPNSGTAVLLEVARCFGEMLAEGWKPARNIILASWDGEEYGLLGSTAWVEDNSDMVQKTVVAYLNVDVAVTGPTFYADATPSLESVIHQAARQVIDPNSGKPLSEVWNTTVGTLGSGSDYTAFLDHFGIPCTDMGFDGPYGVYHSIYDDLQWMLNFGDPTFAYHKAAVQMWGLIAMKLVDSEIIPYNFTMYADRLVEYRQTLVQTLQEYNVSLDLIALDNAINAFKTSARKIETEILNQTLPTENLNDRMVFTEREFLSSIGVPNRPYYKHVIQAPGLYAGYAAETFPGLSDAIMYGNSTTVQQQYTSLWQQISKAASLLGGAVPKPHEDTDKPLYPITIE